MPKPILILLLLAACQPLTVSNPEPAPTHTIAASPKPSDSPATIGSPRSTQGIDLSRLPIGDGKVGSSAEIGSVYACQTRFGPAPPGRAGAWLRADGSFDYAAKPSVDGEVDWPHQFTISLAGEQRLIAGNDLPDHPTGSFPVSATDDAYAYDRNPNRIRAQRFSIALPKDPVAAATAACLPMGAVGVLISGGYVFNALDAGGRDAVAHEIQDGCQGHPERSGSYHYHNLSDCLADPGSGHSALLGYAFDGFGIYGHRGEGGKVLRNADLDACHGHRHELLWDGKLQSVYHYHATWEYPYTLGCYKGTPARPEAMR